MTDTPDFRLQALMKSPILIMGGKQTPLYSYKIEDGGIYFVDMSHENFTPGDSVVFAPNFILINSVGRTYRVQCVNELIKANAERAYSE